MIYLTTKDLCKMFSVTRQTINRWAKEGMPYIKKGHTIRFKESEVIEWFENKNN